jgi:predicted amidohydrolase
MKIGLAQICCIPGDIDKNIEKFDKFAVQAKSLGCDLIVFPEMSFPGYDFKDYKVYNHIEV